MEAVSVTDLTVGSKPFTDRDYTFTNVGIYPNTCFFIRSANDDKIAPSNSVQTSIHVRFPCTIYLDFWGGQNHLNLVSAAWIGDWNDASEAIPTLWGNNGPGKVMKQNFDAGTINLMGNNGGTLASGHGTYYAFVCPQGSLISYIPV